MRLSTCLVSAHLFCWQAGSVQWKACTSASTRSLFTIPHPLAAWWTSSTFFAIGLSSAPLISLERFSFGPTLTSSSSTLSVNSFTLASFGASFVRSLTPASVRRGTFVPDFFFSSGSALRLGRARPWPSSEPLFASFTNVSAASIFASIFGASITGESIFGSSTFGAVACFFSFVPVFFLSSGSVSRLDSAACLGSAAGLAAATFGAATFGSAIFGAAT